MEEEMQADSRLGLQRELEEILGSKNVYFQPPESVKVKYPCIIYYLTDAKIFYADDVTYNYDFCYEVTLVSKDEDLETIDKIQTHFKKCSYDSHYISDSMYCDAFRIYYN